jgi:hypothetical protein
MDRHVAFTAEWIASLEYQERCEFRDTQTPGLVLRVGPTSKTFYLYRRSRVRGRSLERKIRLGNTNDISPAAARRLALKLSVETSLKKRRGSTAPELVPVRLDEEMLTTAEAAQLTRMSPAWFERKRWEGEGPPYYRAGRAVRYLRGELLDWWKSRGGL